MDTVRKLRFPAIFTLFRNAISAHRLSYFPLTLRRAAVAGYIVVVVALLSAFLDAVSAYGLGFALAR